MVEETFDVTVGVKEILKVSVVIEEIVDVPKCIAVDVPIFEAVSRKLASVPKQVEIVRVVVVVLVYLEPSSNCIKSPFVDESSPGVELSSTSSNRLAAMSMTPAVSSSSLAIPLAFLTCKNILLTTESNANILEFNINATSFNISKDTVPPATDKGDSTAEDSRRGLCVVVGEEDAVVLALIVDL